MQVHICSGGVQLLIAGLIVVLSKRENIMRLLSSIIGISLVLIFSQWVMSTVVERDHLRNILLVTGVTLLLVV